MPNLVSFTSAQDPEMQAIERRRRLAEMLQQQAAEPMPVQQNAPISPLSGLAKALRGYTAGSGMRKADEAEKAYQDSFGKELANVLGGGTSASTNPQIQMLAAQLRADKERQAAELATRKAEQEAVLTPEQEAQKLRLAQAGRGQELSFDQRMQLAQARGSQQQPPSNIQEWQAYQQMPPEQKEEYLRMKRAAQWVDTGGQQVSPSMAQPTAAPVASFEKTPTPKDADKMRIAEEKRAKQAANVIKTSDSVIQEIDKAVGKVGGLETGFTGKALANVPGTDSYSLAKTIQTIKSNIGFDRLQAMRDASPTGGALGQVAVQELEGLQNSIVALDQGLNEEELKANLAKVKTHYENWKKTVGAPPADDGWGIEEVK